MNKVLIIASVASMIDQFNMANISILKKQGYEVHVAANFEGGNTSSKLRIAEFILNLEGLGVKYWNVSFSRKIFDVSANIKAYKKIKNLILEMDYDFLHCHSPIGGVCGRLASCGTKTRVIYTAHGFHFFKGGPVKDWILYYPIEKLLACFTDVLITINKEDFHLATKYFKARQINYIPGVGLDTVLFAGAVVDRNAKRQEIGVPLDAIMLFSVGELDRRKNHEAPIRALAKANNKNIFYVICGIGNLDNFLKTLSKDLGVGNRVLFIGFRADVADLCKSSDIYILPSQREGLGIAGLEGMASGLPLISSYVNGIKDYTKDGVTGFCLHPFDVDGFAEAIDKLAGDASLREKIGKHNLEVVKSFDVEIVNEIMVKIYQSLKI